MAAYQLAKLAHYFFRVLQLLIIIRILMSWIPNIRYTDFYKLIHRLTEPLMKPFRRMFGMNNVGLDFSPIIVLFLIQLAERFVIKLLLHG